MMLKTLIETHEQNGDFKELVNSPLTWEYSDRVLGRVNPANLMRSWISCFLAALLCAACLIPAPASAYYYHGRYYRYRYNGHYYRYSYRGHYYQYLYQGRYYRHRTWVVGSTGRPGYYRYW
jgi:hypothetical protein